MAAAAIVVGCGDISERSPEATPTEEAATAGPTNPFAQAEAEMNQRMIAAVGADVSQTRVKKIVEPLSEVQLPCPRSYSNITRLSTSAKFSVTASASSVQRSSSLRILLARPQLIAQASNPIVPTHVEMASRRGPPWGTMPKKPLCERCSRTTSAASRFRMLFLLRERMRVFVSRRRSREQVRLEKPGWWRI